MADPLTSAKDAAYVAVGLGVLGFQRAQVRRRELQKALNGPMASLRPQLNGARDGLGRLARELDDRIDPVVTEVDSRLEAVEERLAYPARELLGQARQQAKETRARIRGFLPD